VVDTSYCVVSGVEQLCKAVDDFIVNSFVGPKCLDAPDWYPRLCWVGYYCV
jgi:hypothetical protein